MRSIKRLKLLLPGALLLLAACGQLPETTENARGVFRGLNLVLAMSVLFVVAAVGLIAGAIAVDRFFRSRQALSEEPVAEPEEEPEEELVAGIRVGRAAVPRWLYLAYVVIPLFAFLYVFSNIRPPEAVGGDGEETPAPEGACTECEVAAVPPIAFDKEELTVAAGEAITVAFSNDEQGVPHTFTVWESEADAGGGESVADSGSVPGGGSRNVEFDAPEAGTTWYFNCTIHPAMNGDVVAEDA